MDGKLLSSHAYTESLVKTLGGFATGCVANYSTGLLLAEGDMPLCCVLLEMALAVGALDIVWIGA